jgi:hypothetical protein
VRPTSHTRRHRHGSPRLHDQLRPFEELKLRLGEHVLRHHADVVDVALDEGEGDITRSTHRDAVGHGPHGAQWHRMPGEK